MGAGGKKRYKLRIHGVGRAGTSTVFPQAVFALCDLDHQKLRRQTIRHNSPACIRPGRQGRGVYFVWCYFGRHYLPKASCSALMVTAY